MSRGRGRWIALGAMYGFAAGMAARGFVDYLEAVTQQYVRTSPTTVVRVHPEGRLHP